MAQLISEAPEFGRNGRLEISGGNVGGKLVLRRPVTLSPRWSLRDVQRAIESVERQLNRIIEEIRKETGSGLKSGIVSGFGFTQTDRTIGIGAEAEINGDMKQALEEAQSLSQALGFSIDDQTE